MWVAKCAELEFSAVSLAAVLDIVSINLAVKTWPNARNISTLHLATLLGTTCCIRLATMLRCVATCWMMLDQI